jgi:hypothetical protein
MAEDDEIPADDDQDDDQDDDLDDDWDDDPDDDDDDQTPAGEVEEIPIELLFEEGVSTVTVKCHGLPDSSGPILTGGYLTVHAVRDHNFDPADGPEDRAHLVVEVWGRPGESPGEIRVVLSAHAAGRVGRMLLAMARESPEFITAREFDREDEGDPGLN